MLSLFSYFTVDNSKSQDITKNNNNNIKSENNHDWNVYGYENMSVQNFTLILNKQNGHYSRLFEKSLRYSKS